MTSHQSLHHCAFLLALFCLALTSGFFSGRTIANHQSPITYSEDNTEPVPVVSIEGIRNGLLHGKISGRARLVIAGTVLTQSGVFVADANTLLRNEIWVSVPENAEFVASKKGKKYYPVDASAGNRIIPTNRIYFSTQKEAEDAGYTLTTNDQQLVPND